MELEGFNKLTEKQKNDFTNIFDHFLAAQGTVARKNMIFKSVKFENNCFRIDFSRYGKPTYSTLDHERQEWG
jgi:hypothetical protein